MISQSIQSALHRLQLHPANLDVAAENDGSVLLRGSLLACWDVPKSVDGQWFLGVLNGLPDNAGPQATMNAYFEASKSAAPHTGPARRSSASLLPAQDASTFNGDS